MKVVQKIKEWKRNRPKSPVEQKETCDCRRAALVVAAGLAIGGKILVDRWQFKNYKVITTNRAGRYNNDS